MPDSLAERVDSVARHTIETIDVDDPDQGGRGIALSGLTTYGDRFADEVRPHVDRVIDSQTDEGLLAYGWSDYPKEWGKRVEGDTAVYKPTINSALFTHCVLDTYEQTGEAKYLDALRRQYEFYENADRTEDGAILRRLHHQEIFTEGIYYLGQFFLRYGAFVDEYAPKDEAVRQVSTLLSHLRDERTGLYRHIWRERPNQYPRSQFWARANGWAVAGLLDTILLLPEDDPSRAEFAGSLRESLSALVPLQDRTGFWHLVLDDPESPLETSGTLIFAYTMKRGLDEGVLAEESYEDAAERAMDAATTVVTDEGEVQRVAKPPASAHSPLGFTYFGQGWYLMAASAFP